MKNLSSVKKLILCVFAVFFLCFNVVEANDDMKDTNYIAYGTAGESIEWKLDSTGTLIFSGSGNIENIDELKMYADIVTSLRFEEGIQEINVSFDMFKKLQGNLIIPDSVYKIGNDVFCNCTGLDGYLQLSDNLTYIGRDAFRSCCNLKGQLILPESLQTIALGAFQDCSSFSGELKIPSHISQIESDVFKDCTGFTGDLLIPANIKEIDENAFEGCVGLDGNLLIDEGVTHIRRYAFKNCSNLKNRLVLPASLERLCFSAFQGCSSLKEVIFLSDDCTTLSWPAYDTFPQNATIVGFMDSTAYEYAKEYGFDFEKICYAEIESDSYVYSGNEIIPEVVVFNYDGDILEQGKDYEIEYPSESRDVGSYSIKISYYANGRGQEPIEWLDYSIINDIKAPENVKSELFGGHDDVKISWDAVTGAVGYDLYYKKATEKRYTHLDTVLDTKYTKKDLLDNVKYNFKIVPLFILNEEVYYYEDVFSITNITTKKNVKAPSKLNVVLSGYDDVKLNWSKSKGASGYNVYYKKSVETKYKKYKTTSARTCYVKNLSDGISYDFKIVPYYKNGSKKVEGYYYVSNNIYTLKKLNDFSLKKVSSSKIKLTWNPIKGNTGYQISCSTNKSKTNIVLTTKSSSVEITPKKNRTYYYKVRAYKNVGNTKVYGPWTNVKTYALREVGMVNDINAQLVAYNMVRLNWNKVKGANMYEISGVYGRNEKLVPDDEESTTYLAESLVGGVKHTFVITPMYVNWDGTVFAKGTSKSITIYTLKKLPAPTIEKMGEDALKINWNNIEGETGYQISCSSQKGKTNIVKTIKTTEKDSIVISKEINGKYYFKVRPYKVERNKKIYAPWSDEKIYIP